MERVKREVTLPVVMKPDLKTVYGIECTQDFELRTDFKNKVILRMFQTLQQNIFNIPCLEMGKLLKHSIRIRYNEPELQSISDLLYENIQDLKRNELEKKDLFRRFVHCYDIFNFLIPEIEFERGKFEEKEKFCGSIDKLKNSFLNTMASSPYLMKEEKNDGSEEIIALNIYYRENHGQTFDYLLQGSDLKAISKEDLENKIHEFSNLEKLVKKVRRTNDKIIDAIKGNYENEELRSVVAKILSLGVKIPELYLLEDKEFDRSEFIIRQIAENYGEFEMPVSKYFEDTIREI